MKLHWSIGIPKDIAIVCASFLIVFEAVTEFLVHQRCFKPELPWYIWGST